MRNLILWYTIRIINYGAPPAALGSRQAGSAHDAIPLPKKLKFLVLKQTLRGNA